MREQDVQGSIRALTVAYREMSMTGYIHGAYKNKHRS